MSKLYAVNGYKGKAYLVEKVGESNLTIYNYDVVLKFTLVAVRNENDIACSWIKPTKEEVGNNSLFEMWDAYSITFPVWLDSKDYELLTDEEIKIITTL